MPPKFELKRRALTTAIQAAETLMAAITTAFAGVPVVTKDVLSIWTDQLVGKMLCVTKASDLAMDLAKNDLEVDEVSNAIDAIEDRAASTRAAIMTYTARNYPVQPAVPQNLPPPLNPTINSSIKRKPLEVPKFDDRRPEDWSGFWRTFSVQYGDDTQLDNINKLLHLRTYLHGDALNDIKALEITVPNYLVAVDRLKKKYGDKLLLENRFINNLSVLPAVKDEKDHAGLQRLHRHVEINIENLSNIDVGLEEYQRTLFPTLATAIPRTLMREYDRENAAERSVPRLMNWLHDFVTKEAQYEMMASQSKQTASHQKSNVTPDAPSFKREKRRFDRKDKRVQESSASMMSIAVKACQFCESKSHDQKVCPLNAEERMAKLKAKNVCFRCLGRTPHPTKECRTSMKCFRCEGQHHTYLCTKPKSTANNESSSERQIEATEIKQNAVVSVNRPAVEFLMIQMAQLSGEKLQTRGVCYIDGGAQRTFIRADVAQKLKLKKLGTEKINFATFGQHPKMEVRNRVQVKIQPINGTSPAILIDAIETPRCTTTPTEIPTPQLSSKLKDLGIQVNCRQAALHSSEVDILLGVDHYNKITTGQSKFIEENLAAVNTILGWTLHGQTTQGTQLIASPTQANKITIIPFTDDLLRKFWELESIGVQHESMTTTGDEEIMKKFDQTINWTGSHYSVQLPWTVNPDELADNYQIAEQRFLNLIRRFRKQPNLYLEYKKVIDEQIEQSIVEEVPKGEISGPVYYMPHRPVVKEERVTTKLRIVFDASSHKKGQLSLNDCLSKGANLLPSLIFILLKFRIHEFALIADIKKAFHQIEIAMRDRDATRFFWIDELWDGIGRAIIKILRQTRVLFGAAPSPFLLSATIKHHLKKFKDEFPLAVEFINRFLYMDDLISSLDSERKAEEIFRQARVIIAAAGMEFVKWQTNSTKLRAIMRREVPSDRDLMNDEETKVLGLRWSPNSDQIGLAVEIAEDVGTKQITKRRVICITAQIFDPLGFASPFTITAKIFFQTLWIRKLKWDKKLNEEMQETWEKWAKQIPNLKEVQLPRWIGFKPHQENEIHIFCDASPRAYGAVAYMRRKEENSIIISFLFSKSRVAPVKQLTLPKLELMGALLAVRLRDQLMEVMDCNRYHYWTDSQICLHWITNTSKRPPTFINNRAIEIREKSHVKAWKHVAGPENPADRLTRGIDAAELTNDELWWKGPKWLSEEQENWPNNKMELTIDPDELDSEADEHEEPSGETHANAVQQKNNQNIAFPISRSYLRTCRVWAWCYCFAHNSKQKADSGHRQQGVLNAEELVTAKQKLIIASQRQHYAAEMKQLTEGKPLMAASKLKLLNPFIDANGVMRLRTRLQTSKDEQTATQPIVLPQKCELTKLIFSHSHSQVLHCGLTATLAQFRESYWTPAARRTLKSTLSRCVTCKKVQGKLMQESPGLLPFDRITRCEPFAVTGVDFAGPLYIRGCKTKAYIALFTCANIRAVHLELVPSLNTPDFVDAFERFVSRRGLPKTLYSNNGTTFRRTNKELAALLNNTKDESFKNYLCNKGINWKFIVEHSPWWGGFWERMVKTVKSCLKKIIGTASLNFFQLNTLLTQVEAVLNHRPLTYVYEKPDEPESLTPAHFVTGERVTFLPDPSYINQIEPTQEAFIRQWRHRQKPCFLFGVVGKKNT